MMFYLAKTACMSLKQLSKTRWNIENNRITIYPYGLYYILGAVLAILFAGIFSVYMYYLHTNLAGTVPFILLMLLMVVLFWGYAGTSIEFDNDKGLMRKKYMGIIAGSPIPFEKLHGINAVTNVGGGYNYRLYRKDDRYGKGITVSSGYGKNDDPNAIAFVEDIVPLIHGFLDQHDRQFDAAPDLPVTYKYFDTADGRYVLKKNIIAFGNRFT
jgi:hypothetical protein